jgi:hypothetical protein
MKKYLLITFLVALASPYFKSCQNRPEGTVIRVYIDSVLADISNHPVGINK